MASLTYPTDVGPYPSSPDGGGSGGGISEGEADTRYTRRSLNASDFSDVATVRENIGVPVVDVAASGPGSTPTPYDAAIEAFPLSPTTFSSGTTFPLDLDSSAVDPGSAARVGYTNPAGPDGYGPVALELTVTSGTMVNGAQSFTLVDAAGTPVGQVSISGDVDGFAVIPDPSFQRFGSGPGGTQTLKWVIPAGYQPGDLTLVIASGAIAGGPTLPNIEVTGSWEYGQSSAQAVVSSFQSAHIVYVDWDYFATIADADVPAFGTRLAGFTHKPASPSSFSLTDGVTEKIWTYNEGVLTLDKKQPTVPFIISAVQGLAEPLTDLARGAGFFERESLTIVGRNGFTQHLPNPVLSIAEPIVSGATYPLADSFTVVPYLPANDSAPAIGVLPPVDSGGLRIGSRIFTHLNWSTDPTYVALVRGQSISEGDDFDVVIRDGLVDTDGSVTGIVGVTYLPLPFNGSITLLANDQIDPKEWVVESSTGVVVSVVTGDGSTTHTLPNGASVVYSDSSGGDTKLVLPDPTLQADGDEIKVVGVGTGLGILNGTGIPALDVQPNTVIDCYAYTGAWYASGATQGLVVD